MMGHREKLKGGNEWACTSRWWRACATRSAGINKALKRKMNKRARKDAKLEIVNYD